jgi:hypothetical protein
MRTGIYVSLKLVDTVWFLVRELEPYYGKYKGILATDNMVQLKRYYGSATGSLNPWQTQVFARLRAAISHRD